jgi:hypothetical protein
MPDGADLAREAAQAILLRPDLGALVTAVATARHTQAGAAPLDDRLHRHQFRHDGARRRRGVAAGTRARPQREATLPAGMAAKAIVQHDDGHKTPIIEMLPG